MNAINGGKYDIFYSLLEYSKKSNSIMDLTSNNYNGISMVNSILNKAIIENNPTIFKELFTYIDIKQIAFNINEKDINGNTLLINSIKKNNINITKLILDYANKHKINLNIYDGSISSPLVKAIDQKNIEIINLLLNYYIVVNVNLNIIINNNERDSLILYAIKKNNNEIIKLLLNYADSNNIKLNIGEKDLFGNDPLIYASFLDNTDMFKLIIEYAIKNYIYLLINEKNQSGNNSLLFAISRNNNDNILSLISYANYRSITLKINEKNENGNYPLMLAIKKNNIIMVKSLVDYGISHGMSLNIIDKDDMTPLILAYKLNYQDIYDYLYKKWGNTHKDLFLYHAIDNNDTTKVISLIIDYNASFNYIHSSKNSSLDLIISKGNNTLLNFIVMNGGIQSSILNRTNADGIVPIVSVIKNTEINNKSRIIEEFIKLGANVNYIDTNGNSPLYYTNDSTLMKILESNNAVNIHNRIIDISKFKLMIKLNELDKIKSMLESNSKLNINYQTEIVNYAIELKKTEIVRYLIFKGFSHSNSIRMNKRYNYLYNSNRETFEYNNEGREIYNILSKAYRCSNY